MQKQNNSHWLSGFLMLGIFVMDIMLPKHISVGSLYLLSLVLVLNKERSTIRLFASAAILLMVMESLINWSGTDWIVHLDTFISIAVIGISAFIIGLKRRKEEAMAEQEKLFHDTLDNMMEGVQIIGDDWRYEYVNKSVVIQSKRKREDLLGRTMMECYPGIERSPLFSVLEDCKRNRKRRYFENEFVYPDGTKGWFELSIQPIERGLFVLSIDITERKMQELRQQEYVAGLEQLVFMISHKVRSPVANIMGIAHLMEVAEHPLEELQTLVDHIRNSAGSLDVFTREMGDYLTELQAKAKG